MVDQADQCQLAARVNNHHQSVGVHQDARDGKVEGIQVPEPEGDKGDRQGDAEQHLGPEGKDKGPKCRFGPVDPVVGKRLQSQAILFGQGCVQAFFISSRFMVEPLC